MSIFSLGFFAVFAGIAAAAAGPLLSAAGLPAITAAGLPAMTAALERGDSDEASRIGAIAGPAVVEAGLADPARPVQLAAIAAAPAVEGRAELLPALASLAQSGDRRAAIPAARAARTIARELALAELPDDLDTNDVATWRALFDSVAKNPQRFIEVRVLALDTVGSLAQVLDPQQVGFDLIAALADPDPALRVIAVQLVPRPTPTAARAPLAAVVKNDDNDALVLAAAQVLCGDDPQPAQALLGAQGLDRIKKLVAGKPARAVRDAKRCLAR